MIALPQYAPPFWWTTAATHRKYLNLALGVCLFVAAYYVALQISDFHIGPVPSLLWVPDSILLCALLRARPRYWWIFLALTVPMRLLENTALRPAWYLLGTLGIDAVKAMAGAC